MGSTANDDKFGPGNQNCNNKLHTGTTMNSFSNLNRVVRHSGSVKQTNGKDACVTNQENVTPNIAPQRVYEPPSSSRREIARASIISTPDPSKNGSVFGINSMTEPFLDRSSTWPHSADRGSERGRDSFARQSSHSILMSSSHGGAKASGTADRQTGLSDLVVPLTAKALSPFTSGQDKFSDKIHAYGQRLRFALNDPFRWLVHLPWLHLFALLTFFYVLSWAFWTVILVGSIQVTLGEYGFQECLYKQSPSATDNVLHDAYFYFVVQSMATIGYGNYAPTCMITNVAVCFMKLHGTFLDVVLFGIIFSKFSRARPATLLVSDMLCLSTTDDIAKETTSPVETGSKLTCSKETNQNEVNATFRLVNFLPSRQQLHPSLDCYLCIGKSGYNHDIDTMFTSDTPVVKKVASTSSIPLKFLEWPVLVTAKLPASVLDELARDESLEVELIMVFSASEPVTGNSFDVRKSWSLKHDTVFHREFAPLSRSATGEFDLTHFHDTIPVMT